MKLLYFYQNSDNSSELVRRNYAAPYFLGEKGSDGYLDNPA